MSGRGAILAFLVLMATIASTATGTEITVSLNFGYGPLETIDPTAPQSADLDEYSPYPGLTEPYGYYEGTIPGITVYAEHPFVLNAEDTVNYGMMKSGTDTLQAPLEISFGVPGEIADYQTMNPDPSMEILSGEAWTEYERQLDFRQLIQTGDQIGSYTTKISLIFGGTTP